MNSLGSAKSRHQQMRLTETSSSNSRNPIRYVTQIFGVKLNTFKIQ